MSHNNTDVEALMAQNGESKGNARKRVLVVGAGAAGYVYTKIC